MRLKLLISLLLFSLSAAAQVTFHDGFDSASLGSVEIVEEGELEGEQRVYRITQREDPINPLDSAAWRSNRWFYLLVCGVKDKQITIEIPNTDMQRGVYSYDNHTFMRFSEEESPLLNGRITKRFTHDSVYLAYCTPYPLSRHQEQMRRWCAEPCVKSFKVGESGTGGDIDCLVITSDLHTGLIPDESGKIIGSSEDLEKRVVYIHGRIHPSETPSSWHLEALVDRIIEDENEILQNTIFYIIPFINPDGVYQGWSRTDSYGVNLENNYNHPQSQTQPEVLSAKRLLLALQAADLAPSIALNMHSQSTPKITYWVHNSASTSQGHFSRSMLFAALSTESNPHFHWHNLSYSSLKDRFIEGWIYRQFKGEMIALTFETPYSFYDDNAAGEWVSVENLQQQSLYTLNAITDILGVATRSRITIDEPEQARGFRHIKSGKYIHHLGSHQLSRRGGFSIRYRHDSVAKGEYDIYKWVVARMSRKQRHDIGRWELVGEYVQQSSGEFEYELFSHTRGERFDRLQLRLKDLP